MNEKLTKQQFDSLYEQLNVPASISRERIYEAYEFAIENAEELSKSNALGKNIPINSISLVLYIVNEYAFFYSINKVEDNDDNLSKIISVALDKYFTNEHLNYRNAKFISKFSPVISTIEIYLNFVLGILKRYPQKNPQETLLLDMTSKGFQLSKAIIELVLTGFETEAFSTWRTLHETECILLLVNKYGEGVTKSYLKHMKYALAYRGAIQSKEETDKVFVEIKDEMKKLDLKSKDMKKFIEYGWLTSIDGYNSEVGFKFNFRDGVERLAGLTTYSTMYEMASEIAHSSPLLIYSRPKYYYHLSVLLVYETFFRLEKVFSGIYLNRIDKEEAKRYMMMRNIYYSTLQVIYQNERRMFETQFKK